MSGIYDHLLGRLNVGFRTEPTDLYHTYLEKWGDEDRATTMPPSPSVNYYFLEGYLDLDSLRYDYTAHVEWAPWIRQLVSEIEPWQITHRSREVAAAAGALRENEIHYRLQQLREHRHAYLAVALKRREAEEAFNLLIDTTLEYIDLDYSHILRYVKDHENSSVGRGIKWREAYSFDRGQWSELKDKTVELIERVHQAPYKWSTTEYFTGMRPRSEPLTGVRDTYTNTILRSRPIYFDPAWSGWTMFIPNKVGWMRKLMRQFLDLVGFRAELHTPYLEGGQVYAFAANKFAEGSKFQAFDGKVWDSGLCYILGPVFRPFFLNFQQTSIAPAMAPDYPEEYASPGEGLGATGQTVNSILDLWAMVTANRHMTGYALGLGDDWNTWGAKGVPKIWPIEFQPADTKYGYVLGAAFLGQPDPYAPRISGIRLTMDRAGKFRPAPTHGEVLEYEEARTPVQRALHSMMYKARYGKGTLYEVITKLKPGEWVSGELYERIAGTVEYTDSEVLESARELGISFG
jgi:hypothetical protein